MRRTSQHLPLNLAFWPPVSAWAFCQVLALWAAGASTDNPIIIITAKEESSHGTLWQQAWQAGKHRIVANQPVSKHHRYAHAPHGHAASQRVTVG